MRNDTCSGTDVSVFPVQRPGQSVDREDAEIRRFSKIAVTLLLFRTMTPLLPPSEPSHRTVPTRILSISRDAPVCGGTFLAVPSAAGQRLPGGERGDGPAHHADRRAATAQ